MFSGRYGGGRRRQEFNPADQGEGNLDRMIGHWVRVIRNGNPDDDVSRPHHVNVRVTDFNRAAIRKVDAKWLEGPPLQQVVQFFRLWHCGRSPWLILRVKI